MTIIVNKNQSLVKNQIIYRRIAAYFIDVTLLTFVVQGAQWGLSALTGGQPFAYFEAVNSGGLIYAWILATVSLPIWLYFILSERSIHKATIGKRLLGLQVISENESKASTGQLISRTVLKLLSWEIFHLTFMFPVPLLADPTAAFRPGFIVGFLVLALYVLVMFRTAPGQSIHDLIAKTAVVTKR